ncbi:DUF7561 family protein [Halomarina ordinaria]|uniref:Small CPxCG-related zinc finger protein n=1 Tax=Halomarina ordinaria TaxID=3033939 RepID=A0ABD5UA24_9EURY|nr:hypothetical protein [Halomarina sp. PSRA2]
MASEPCDGCGRRVRIAGGVGDILTTDSGPTGGMTLELSNGTEYFLCFDCLGALPEDPTPGDVHALDDR